MRTCALLNSVLHGYGFIRCKELIELKYLVLEFVVVNAAWLGLLVSGGQEISQSSLVILVFGQTFL